MGCGGRTASSMMAMTAHAPLDPAAVAAVIAPVERARTLPAAAYLDPRSSRGSGGGSSTTAGCASVAPPTCRRRVTSEPSPSGRPACCSCATAPVGSRCSRTRAACGHELLPCGADTTDRGTILCPYHGWAYASTAACATRRASVTTSRSARARPASCGCGARSTAEWTFVNVSGTAARCSTRWGTWPRSATYPLDDLVVGASHRYELRGQLEDRAGELPRVLPLPADPPRARADQPGRLRRRVRRSPGRLGRRHDGADRRSRHDVARRAQRRRCSRACGGRLEREIVYAGVFPNLLLSLHPDYVMTHRKEPVAQRTGRSSSASGSSPEVVARPDFDPSCAVDFWDLTNRQDWARSRACSRACRPAGCRGGSPSSRTTCGASPTSQPPGP